MKREKNPMLERIKLRRQGLSLLISGCKADALAIFGRAGEQSLRAALAYAQQADDELARVEAALRGWPMEGR